MRTIAIILTGCLLILAAGCQGPDSRSPLTDQISMLKREKADLTRQITQYQEDNEQLRKQVQVLSGIPDQIRPETLYCLERIKITGYTNLYDKDRDGKRDKLIVYIKPIDEYGDIIKAAGTVDLQLWDLNKKDTEALLGQWRVEANELKKLWFATLITINYRLTFDVAGKIDKFEQPLTVKVTFTDYLSGKVFEEQKVIKPRWK